MEGLRAIVRRIAIAGFAWWVLSEGAADSWGVGIVTVLIAVAASLWLVPDPGGAYIKLRAVPGFVGFFLVQSLRAGLQVAVLALSPRSMIQPCSTRLALVLPPGPPRYMLAGTVSLLPGTLSVKLDDGNLLVHALTSPAQAKSEIRELEARIAPLFGVTA